jgi:hypothetical protein
VALQTPTKFGQERGNGDCLPSKLAHAVVLHGRRGHGMCVAAPAGAGSHQGRRCSIAPAAGLVRWRYSRRRGAHSSASGLQDAAGALTPLAGLWEAAVVGLRSPSFGSSGERERKCRERLDLSVLVVDWRPPWTGISVGPVWTLFKWARSLLIL